jgi:HK97 family phage major capsid protein
VDYENLKEFRTVEELVDHQKGIRADIIALADVSSGQPLSQEDTERLAAMKDEDEEITRRVSELEGRLRLIGKMAEDPAHVERWQAPAVVRKPGPDEVYRTDDLIGFGLTRAVPEAIDRALRAVEIASFPHSRAKADEAKERIEKLVRDDSTGSIALRVIQTGGPLYDRAFGKYLKNQPRNPEEERVLSISGGGGDEGGFAIPFTLDPTLLLTSNGVVNPLRQISRVVTITGNEWRGVSTDGVIASYAAEATETDDNAPTLAQPTINVEKAQAFIPFSIEVGEDWAGMRAEMARVLQDSKDTLEADKFLNGAGHGSDEPEGLLTGATNDTDTAGSNAFTVDDLYTLTGLLPDRYQPNATIIANRAIFNEVRQFDTSGGADLWVQLGASQPATLLGYPARQLSTLEGDLTQDPNTIMVIGDFSRFVIVDRVGLNVELIPHLFGATRHYPTGQRGLYAYWRNSSGVVDANAFVALDIKS